MKILKKIFLVGLATVGIFWFFSLTDTFTLPNVAWLEHHNPVTTAFMDRYKGAHPLDYQFVSYNQISPHLKQAVVLAEDALFFSHHGFDFESIRDALEKNWKKKKFARGASTITQQLAKNLYLTPTKSPLRKFKEMLITLQLERHLSKQRILELYLNVVEWGEGIYGAESAAKHYFHKSASRLSASEAAWLAAILPSPRYFALHPQHAVVVRKKSRLLYLMGNAPKGVAPPLEEFEEELPPEAQPVEEF